MTNHAMAIATSGRRTSTNFGVSDPTISVVFDTETGLELRTDELLAGDEDRVMQLRFSVKKSIQDDQAKYLCPECFVPVALVSRRESRRFFFRHLVEDGRCSAVTRGDMSQDDINARKYNGAKESYLHRQMKQWLIESLAASGKFTSIAAEARWTGLVSPNWRRPDVTAMYGDLKIAFEVQLSTTFLDVIAKRWTFYQREGGLLFWIFANFADDARRLMQDDVFFINNHNAFIVSESTRDASVKGDDFLLDCAWSEPIAGHLVPRLERSRVAFSQLTLDPTRQQAYYFDYQGRKVELAAQFEAERQSWPSQFEQWWLELAGKQTSQHDLEDAMAEFPSNAPVNWNDWGILDASPLGAYGRERRLPVAMINAFYSAKHGRPIGLNRRHFIEVAHYVAQSYPGYLRWFRRALEVYDMGSLIEKQDTKGRWKERRMKYKPLLAARDALYEPVLRDRDLFEWLFPELMPMPL